MLDVVITVVKMTFHADLSKKYENVIDHACSMTEGMTFVSKHGVMPEGFCEEAWKSVGPFVVRLSEGETDFFDGWMKDEKTAVISCNDGIRPVSFLLKAL